MHRGRVQVFSDSAWSSAVNNASESWENKHVGYSRSYFKDVSRCAHRLEILRVHQNHVKGDHETSASNDGYSKSYRILFLGMMSEMATNPGEQKK